METTTKRPNCGARLDRLPNSPWHRSMFAMVAFALLVCWSNAIGGLRGAVKGNRLDKQ